MGRIDTFVLYIYLKYKKGKWSELNYFEHIVQFLKGSCDVNIVTVDYSDFLMCLVSVRMSLQSQVSLVQCEFSSFQ